MLLKKGNLIVNNLLAFNSKIKKVANNRICFYATWFLNILFFILNVFIDGISLVVFPLLIMDIIYALFNVNKLKALIILIPLSGISNFNVFSFNVNVLHIVVIVIFCVFIFRIINSLRKHLFDTKILLYSIPFFLVILIKIINYFTGMIFFSNNDDFVGLVRDCLYFVLPFAFLVTNSSFAKKALYTDFLITFTINSIVALVLFKFFPDILNSVESINDTLEQYTRFKGFEWDQNYFSLYAIFFDLIFLCKYFSSLKKDYLIIIFLVLLNAITILSESKMFIVSLILIIVLTIRRATKRSLSDFLVAIAIVGMASCLILFVFSGTIINFLESRIFESGAANFSNDFLSKLTTGRTVIFSDYSEYVMSKPWIFLFGLNFNNYLIDSYAIHNTFGYFVFFYGFPLACLIFAIYKKWCFDKIKTHSLFNNIIILIIFFICLSSLNLYFSHNGFSLFFIFIASLSKDDFVDFDRNKNNHIANIDTNNICRIDV